MRDNKKYAIWFTLYSAIILGVFALGHGFIIMPYEGSWTEKLVKRLCKYSGQE